MTTGTTSRWAQNIEAMPTVGAASATAPGGGTMTVSQTSNANLGQLAAAVIKNKDTGAEVTCHFRPKEYSFTKSNKWTEGKMVGAGFEQPTFSGSDPQKLKLDLLFDTFEQGTDVRNVTKAIWEMMRVTEVRTEQGTRRGVPPHVEFRWGQLGSFEAVITSITEKFTLFHPSGYPLRSHLTVDLLQATGDQDWPRQNPTSGAREGYAVHMVKEGETIDWIAFKEYGDSNAYRHLAAANRLDDPSRLYPGQMLLIAPLED